MLGSVSTAAAAFPHCGRRPVCSDPGLGLLHWAAGKCDTEDHHHTCGSAAGEPVHQEKAQCAYRHRTLGPAQTRGVRHDLDCLPTSYRWRTQCLVSNTLTGCIKSCWRRMMSISRRRSVSFSSVKAGDRWQGQARVVRPSQSGWAGSYRSLSMLLSTMVGASQKHVECIPWGFTL